MGLSRSLLLFLALWPTADLDSQKLRGRPVRSTVLLTEVHDADRKSDSRDDSDSQGSDNNFELSSFDYTSDSASFQHSCEPTQKILFTKLKNYSRHSLPNPDGMIVTVELHVQDISGQT